MQGNPSVWGLITTGGTIAGLTHTSEQSSYRSAQLAAPALLKSLHLDQTPQSWRLLSPLQKGSQHLGFRDWGLLLDAWLALQEDPEVEAILITHGTDTLEDTCMALKVMTSEYQLHGRAHKPTCLTGSMLPSDAPGSDAVMNVERSIAYLAFALSQELPNVLGAVMNSHWIAMADVQKAATRGATAFDTPVVLAQSKLDLSDVIGQSSSSKAIDWQLKTQYPDLLGHEVKVWLNRFSNGPQRNLPLSVVYCHPALSGAPVMFPQRLQSHSHLQPTCVLAGLGHGNVPEYMFDSLVEWMDQGGRLVLSTRIGQDSLLGPGEPCLLGEHPNCVRSQGLRLNQVITLESLRLLGQA